MIDLKERNGAKHNTIRSYRDILRRVDPALGGLKLTDIRPQYLNRLYKSLQSPEERLEGVKATGKADLPDRLKVAGLTREALAKAAGVSHTTVTHACRGEPVNGDKAAAMAAVLKKPVQDLFDMTQNLVNIPRETVALLRRYKTSQGLLQLANDDRWKDTGYQFTQDDGRPMNPTSITAWLRKFSMHRGLPHINPHAFRHSVASILISAGTDIVTVSKQLGHAQVSTTGDIFPCDRGIQNPGHGVHSRRDAPPKAGITTGRDPFSGAVLIFRPCALNVRRVAVLTFSTSLKNTRKPPIQSRISGFPGTP